MDHPFSITLPLVSSFGDGIDVTDALFSGAQASGTHPMVVKVTFPGHVDDAGMAAIGYELVTCNDHPDETWSRSLYRGAGGGLLVLVASDGAESRVMVAAAGRDEAADAAAALKDRFAVEPVARDDDSVLVSFRWHGDMGVQSSARDVTGPSWSSIRRNYPEFTREPLDRLMALGGDDQRTGRLILFHGPPGTGKTTAVRSLSRSWSSWCDMSCIVDPEVLFQSSDYLHKLVLDGSDSGRRRRGGRAGATHLIIVEDVDELVKADARDRTGQALSRLLNISDGILGHGLDVVFLLTTNEAVGSLHPAVSRPGRCLANIEFGRFGVAEARTWLAVDGAGEGDAVTGEVTLAELYARRSSGVIAGGRNDHIRTGVYL